MIWQVPGPRGRLEGIWVKWEIVARPWQVELLKHAGGDGRLTRRKEKEGGDMEEALKRD